MKAVLDTCVIYPTVLREILLGVAEAGLYTPLWSDRILEEWARATVKLGAEAETRVQIALLRARFPTAIVRAAPAIEQRLVLPDPDDTHVLAVAIAAQADCIVTFNAADFPRGLLAEEGMDRRDPDGLLWELWSHHPDAVAAVVMRVHAKAERLSGGDLAVKGLLKRARLNRLAKALAV